MDYDYLNHAQEYNETNLVDVKWENGRYIHITSILWARYCMVNTVLCSEIHILDAYIIGPIGTYNVHLIKAKNKKKVFFY